MNIYIDLECIPRVTPTLRDELAAGIKPPATMSKPETIAAWEAEKKPALIDEAVARAGLDAATGMIVCVGFAIEDEPACVISAGGTEDEDECETLDLFFSALNGRVPANSGRRPTLIGHNLAAFDVPYILRRCIVQRIRPPLWWPRNPKPWSDGLFDTMTAWSGDRGTISMDRLCRVLGVPGKGDGPSGADVWPMAQAGKFAEIATYCREDVERTRQIHKRLTFA